MNIFEKFHVSNDSNGQVAPIKRLHAIRFWIASILILLFRGPSLAEDGPRPLTIADVNPLLIQLNSDSRAMRIAAQRKLIAFGKGWTTEE